MISCKKAVDLLSKQMDEPLTESEKKSLQIHLYICEFCEQFRKHLEKIRAGVRSLVNQPTDKKLSGQAKQDLIEKLKAKISRS